ncbi:MAG: hypothetical protein LAQ69_18470 [Acidobacteriia bacterium]|nr:hypothetical protein [Terriglobia bacterium]
MSNVLEQFKINANAKNWPLAIQACNGLNMTEMLQGLDSLSASVRDQFAAQLAPSGPSYAGARINWAIEVVRTRKIPGGAAPGDLLATGQVQQARNFLGKAKALPPVQRKRLKLTLFWTEGAKGEKVSSILVQKAQDLLRANGDKFTLDVDYRKNDIAFKKQIDFEIDACKDTGIEDIRTLVAKSGVCPSDRLAVVFCEPFLAEKGSNDTTGLQCVAASGRCVLINVTNSHPDHGTLMHEVGHGAGNQHESDDSNIMSYGANRTKINFVQLARFDKAFFCA